MRRLNLAAAALALATAAAAAPGAGARPASPFKWAPSAQCAPAQWRQLDARPRALHAISDALSGPTATLPDAHATGYVDAPDGSAWYFTMDYDLEVFSQNEYYTDYSISGVHIVVYDQTRAEVGHVDAAWERPAEVARFQSVQIGAAVTRKFFDSSDDYELMLMINENPAEGYGARQRTMVYPLTADGKGQKVADLPGYYVAAVNAAQDAWSENFYMVFCDNSTWPGQNQDLADFTLYSKAGWNGGVKELQRWELDMRYSYSDGENESLPIIMGARGTSMYVATAMYEKTYFANPGDYEDESLSPDNHYLIHLYKSGWGNLEDLGETSIAVEDPDEGYFMRTYCVGRFLGAGDLCFDFNEAGDELPKYIVRVNQTDYNEGSASYFAAYGHDGKEVRRWGEGATACRRLSPVAGCEEQFCIQTGRGYEMVDFPSLRAVAVVPSYISLGGNDWPYAGDVDRVRCGGSYRYATSLLNGDEDGEGNTLHRVAWYNADGSLDRVDALNLGQHVARAMVYVSGPVLDPCLINTDDAQEYVVYVQRLLSDDSSLAQTHLCVVRADGQALADIPFGLETSDINTVLVNAEGHAALFYYFYDVNTGRYTPSFIDLPLNDFEGAGTVEDPYLVSTTGDMDRVRFNLNAHFRLAGDINYDGAYMKCVTGEFTGSLDGDGHSIIGPVIAGTGSNLAMFASLGHGDGQGDAAGAWIRDLGVKDAHVEVSERNGGDVALLVADAANAQITGVEVDGAVFQPAGSPKCDVGGLVGNASLGTLVKGCRLSGAAIAIPSAYHVGGIAHNLQTGSSIEECQLTGSLEGSKNVGGIVSTTADMGTPAAPGHISDCRATASVKGKANIGGIIGDDPRVPITRCVFSGTLEASEAQTGYYEGSYNAYEYLNVGGVAGRLARGFTTSGGVITGCVADVKAVAVPEGASEQARRTAHRIAGWSSANDEPEIISETYNEETYEYEYVFGDPAPAEAHIRDNYATDALVPFDAALATAEGVEGMTLGHEELTQAFYQGLGYDFALWAMGEDGLPVLFKENGHVGIETIEPQAAVGEPVWYDLTGRRVARPGRGVYVKVTGGKAQKVAR